jgi:SAM-dependent methyltransferase
MTSFSIDGSPSGELVHYVNEAFDRFLRTWRLCRDDQGRALELGANPYFITWLLHDFTALDVSSANYFGASGAGSQVLVYQGRDGTPHERTIDFALFNMEEETFPYADDSFDLVLFCEIIEHLVVDPLHPLREIHRVLKPGGTLILTTPNVARLDNLLTLLEGRNINGPYSGFGRYGRHNREYTQDEVRRLLAFAGFDVQDIFTADAHPEDHSGRPALATLAADVATRAPELGQYIFVRACAARPPRQGLPSWLYQSYPAETLVDS